jgi:hypothetical protein
LKNWRDLLALSGPYFCPALYWGRIGAYMFYIAEYKEKGYNEEEAQMEALRKLSKSYAFSYKEVT